LRGPPSRPLDQSLSGWFSSNSPTAQTGHPVVDQLPPALDGTRIDLALALGDPPQGPLSKLFEQRAIGQMPPNVSSTQSPHPAQRSTQTPCSAVAP